MSDRERLKLAVVCPGCVHTPQDDCAGYHFQNYYCGFAAINTPAEVGAHITLSCRMMTLTQ